MSSSFYLEVCLAVRPCIAYTCQLRIRHIFSSYKMNIISTGGLAVGLGILIPSSHRKYNLLILKIWYAMRHDMKKTQIIVFWAILERQKTESFLAAAGQPRSFLLLLTVDWVTAGHISFVVVTKRKRRISGFSKYAIIHILYVWKVAAVTVSIEETVSLGQGEWGPDRQGLLFLHYSHIKYILPQIRSRIWFGFILPPAGKETGGT